MASAGKSKLKVLYLLKIFQEETDAQHGLTMPQLIERLAEYGIDAERKSIYDDIKVLREFDVDIRTYQRSPVEYALVRSDFTLDNLMLMVDAVQSCRAITEKQARLLTANIKTLATNREQEKLDRRIHVVGRVKSDNDSVLKTVDALHEALLKRCKAAFSYGRIGPDGKRRLTRNGKRHEVSPVSISYDDGFYYLTAWNDDHENLTEYRLDRMEDVEILEDAPATRNEETRNYTFEESNAAVFGRFSGGELTATLATAPDKFEIVFDRFGPAIVSVKEADDEVRTRVRVCKSEQFFGWVAGMGKAVRLVEPESLVEEYRAYLRFLLEY